MGRIVAGFLVLAPVYLACLLLLKAMKTILGLMAPVAKVLPKSVSAENLVALILLLVICFFVGLAVRTRMGRAIKNRLDMSFFQKIPGYSLLRSLTQQLAGETQEQAWNAALIEIEDALVPDSSLKSLSTDVSRSLSLRCLRRWLERSTFLLRIACIAWMFRLHRRS